MRLPVLTFVMVLAAAPAALAAPTCDDAAGRTVRCDAPGSMPIGWTPSPQVQQLRREAEPAAPSSRDLFGVLCCLGGLMALFPLLPDFEDGAQGGWDGETGDED